MTQEFFSRLLELNHFAVADPERGRFRAFLPTALKHFLTNEWEKTRALKRGVAVVFPCHSTSMRASRG